MKITIVSLFLLLSASYFAQDSLRVVKLKPYWNIEQITNSYQSLSNTFISFGIELNSRKNNSFQEFELRKFDVYTKSVRVENAYLVEYSTVNLNLGYEYNFRLFNNTEKVKYYLGTGVSPYFTSSIREQTSSTDFKYGTNNLGMGIKLIPRIKFRVNKKIGFETKLETEVLNINSQTNINENPIIPVGERRTTFTDASLLGNSNSLYVRVGLGVTYQIN